MPTANTLMITSIYLSYHDRLLDSCDQVARCLRHKQAYSVLYLEESSNLRQISSTLQSPVALYVMENVLLPFAFCWGYIHHIAESLTEQVDALDLHGKGRSSVKKCKSIKDKVIKQSRSTLYGSLPVFSKVRLPHSPTPYLLLSNNPPTENEISTITDAIYQAETEAERLADQLERMHRRFSVSRRGLMVLRHEKVTQFIFDHKAIIAPIRRIPPELLQEIFLHAVDSEPWSSNVMSYYSWYHVAYLPLGISQVSTLWRRTALNTPTLWARIPPVSIERKFTAKPRYLAFLAEIISRARGAPLELYIHGPDYMASDVPHPAIEMLITHSMRWKTIIIEIPSVDLSIFDAIKGQLAWLETLVIRGCYFISPNSDIPIDTFRDAPRLQDVRLYQTRSKIINLPFSQLVTYYEEEGHVGQCNSLLASTSSTIQNLSLHIYREIQIAISSPMTTLTTITVLKLRLRFSNTHYLLLEQLFLPALEELLVDSYSTKYPIGSIMSLITRAGKACPLLRLYLRYFLADHGELASLLRQTPLITHLSVDIPSIYDLQSLIHFGDHVLLPSLQNCAFYSEGPLSNDHIDLCRMFAEIRCEQQHYEPGDLFFKDMQVHSDAGDTRCCDLRALYIHYTSSHTAEPQQTLLQQWPSTDVSLRLSGLRVSILERFPEMDSSSALFVREQKSNARLRKQTPYVLSSVRDVEVHDVNDIYTSGLHRTLRQMGVMFEKSSGLKHLLSQSSKQILDQWEAMFNESLGDFRWMMLGSDSLLYVPRSHRMRTSPESARQLIFGEFKDEDIPQSDLAWPSYTEWTS